MATFSGSSSAWPVATCQLATETPVLGSDCQDWHRDTPPLFDDAPETPSFLLAVNFPLVDVDERDGPPETTRGSATCADCISVR